MLPMRRRTLTALVTLVIAAVLLCPISEMFDRWDHTAKTGKDTESTLMLVAECAGAAIAVLHAASSLLPNFVWARPSVVSRAPMPRFDSSLAGRYRFPESPPAPPLRI
jgi:hypothetical protein